MQYGVVEKWGEKKSTLTNYFSPDCHRKFVKFCTKLSELLKINGKFKKNWVKTQKKLLGVFSQVKKKTLTKRIDF